MILSQIFITLKEKNDHIINPKTLIQTIVKT